ncbi:hypothetical protein CYMTET_51545 [Cymbomonas tetramitiformis]|uniref:Uncharacterized protein n=1 Tax=Cymbomonas tetramitiformis TaxID=36881 RepID=A0AAE0ES86_9CHLO|nr:hypothetical protein CYMTET_51545 [Cymbomonas tetramitiformis]
MQPPYDPYAVPPSPFTFPPSLAAGSFPPSTTGPAALMAPGQPSPLPYQPPQVPLADPRLTPLSPYPQPHPSGTVPVYHTPAAVPGPVPAVPWTWSGGFPFGGVPSPYAPALHSPAQTLPGTARSAEEAARWLAYRRQEEAAVLAASGLQVGAQATYGAGGVLAERPGTGYPAGAFRTTGGVHAEHPGEGFPAGAHATNAGGVQEDEPEEEPVADNPCPHDEYLRAGGYSDVDPDNPFGRSAGEESAYEYEADPNDYDEYLRAGGHSDVDPNDPYGEGQRWDEVDDDEEEQEELVVSITASASAQRVVTVGVDETPAAEEELESATGT